ncbi:response regulator transcription factor [Aquimarina sp. AU58]|uniref:response regulator transcription factor n=1 Tax=Aquimarina sp. AU58 TaxID=1874112 RepID=UPI000D6DCF55|nr:helix-turn-helix transcriptional regulator [Aquimarina sp. AU58]
MNTKVKNTPAETLIGQLISNDNSIEFFGIKRTQEVRFLRNGHVYKFDQLDPGHYTLLHNAYMKDKFAIHFIRKQARDSIKKQVELYTYFTYGALDHTPDIIDNILQPAENFRHQKECISLKFDSKKITIDNKPITARELQIIDLVAQDYPDKLIADHLGIGIPTLNTHKAKLFRKINVQSKVGLIKKAMDENIPMI